MPADARRPDTAIRIDAAGCEVTETPEVSCNLIDDDCDGSIDDVDIAGDGICDCLSIGVLGAPGPLASSSFQAWLEARGTTVVRFGEDSSVLDAGVLAPFDIVILDLLPREYAPMEAAALRVFVDGGGGLISLTGHNGGSDLAWGNSLLVSFGVAYEPGLLTNPVTDWTAHPTSTGITSVTFRGGYHVTPAAGDTTVAQLDGGPVGVALERGEGRAFIWGDEWIEYDSEWTTMPMIQQLWANLLAWVGPTDRCDVLF